ncbi:MAG: hypothetical protein HY043_02945 [Verrucomicrobia bacterium]|nr:hypothetical protein [Verrucomicrobiota bacterium]
MPREFTEYGKKIGLACLKACISFPPLLSNSTISGVLNMQRHFFTWLFLIVLAPSVVSAMSLRESLAMFESGARQPQRCAADRVRGSSGEVSRFQIMPEVWRRYTRSRDYENPDVAWAVAERILQDRRQWFLAATNREPSALELYLLWNKPGHFNAAHFSSQRVHPHFKERAERFANLVRVNSA